MEELKLEIERKFKIDSIPEEYSNLQGKSIKQGYIYSNDNFEIRLRKKSDKIFQTIKKGQGISRIESEIEITASQFEKLWNLTTERRIEKTRYEITKDDYVIELDVFYGNLDKLVIAEVEFINTIEAEKFVIPDWFGQELTGDERYKNKNLAVHGLPE